MSLKFFVGGLMRFTFGFFVILFATVAQAAVLTQTCRSVSSSAYIQEVILVYDTVKNGEYEDVIRVTARFSDVDFMSLPQPEDEASTESNHDFVSFSWIGINDYGDYDIYLFTDYDSEDVKGILTYNTDGPIGSQFLICEAYPFDGMSPPTFVKN
jgi:hypothetical protein